MRNSIFDKNDTYSLRGICMILIMLHHIFQYTVKQYGVNYPYPIAVILQNTGYLMTGVFFLISGYGLSKSMIQHSKLTINYVVRNIAKLIEPFLFISAIDMLLCFASGKYEVSTAVINFVTLSLSVGGSLWFMKIIFCLYFTYFFLYSVIQDCRNRTVCLFVLISMYILYMYINENGVFWFNSILCFPLGVLLAINTRLFTLTDKTLTKKVVVVMGGGIFNNFSI